MKSASFLIKPVSGACNIRCEYCFYCDGEGHNRGMMTRETVEALVSRAFEYGDGGVSFAFQGGEPALAGVDFFKDFVEAAERKNRKGVPLSWSIQTNGIALDEEFCSFFADKKFLVGLSLDGPRDIHNRYRRFPDGSGTFDRVISAVECLKNAGVDFNVLTVVTGAACRRTEQLWTWLSGLGVPCLQFILCLENLEGEPHRCAPTEAEYCRFLCRTFSLWKDGIENGDYISVRFFDNIVRAALGSPPELCSLAGRCTNQLVVEADGSCYPCDFYVEESTKTGNIRDNTVSELLNSERAERFILGRPSMPMTCRECRWVRLCGGGCRREFDESGKTSYCAALKRFFAESENDIVKVAEMAAAGKIRSSRK